MTIPSESRLLALLQIFHTTPNQSLNTLAPQEAAHIQSYADGGPSELPNGLLLHADIHTLFDLHLIAIDSSAMTVLVSPELLSTSYGKLRGEPLVFDSGKSGQTE